VIASRRLNPLCAVIVLPRVRSLLLSTSLSPIDN
jgi:hypothetical protein